MDSYVAATTVVAKTLEEIEVAARSEANAAAAMAKKLVSMPGVDAQEPWLRLTEMTCGKALEEAGVTGWECQSDGERMRLAPVSLSDQRCAFEVVWEFSEALRSAELDFEKGFLAALLEEAA